MGKILKSPASLAGAATFGLSGAVLGDAADKATGGKISSGISGITNGLLGKKDPGTSDEVIDLADPSGRAFQGQALGEYGKFLAQDTKQIAANQIEQQAAQIRQNAEDGQRQAQQMVAQRGLGNSSVGLNAILNQKNGVSDKLAANTASLPGLQNQLAQQNLNFASGGINQILNEQGQSKVLKLGQASKGRQGGLLPLIGAGVGAYAGGAGGAQAGLGIGQAATQIG